MWMFCLNVEIFMLQTIVFPTFYLESVILFFTYLFVFLLCRYRNPKINSYKQKNRRKAWRKKFSGRIRMTGSFAGSNSQVSSPTKRIWWNKVKNCSNPMKTPTKPRSKGSESMIKRPLRYRDRNPFWMTCFQKR